MFNKVRSARAEARWRTPRGALYKWQYTKTTLLGTKIWSEVELTEVHGVTLVSFLVSSSH